MNSPLMVVFAGANGGGKSTITKFYSGKVDVVIDPDSIARRLNPEDPAKASFAAGKEALKKVRELTDSRVDFSIETTLGGRNAIRQIEYAKQQGYDVEMHYVGLSSADLHLERVRMRVKWGGHDIAEADIRRRFDTSVANLKIASKLLDSLVIWDNSHFPRVVVMIEKDLVTEQYSEYEYVKERYADLIRGKNDIPPVNGLPRN